MQFDVVLINQPAIDFATFLTVSHEALGYSLAGPSDASRKCLSDSERFLSCLEAMHDPKATPALRPHLQNHVQFSVFIAAQAEDAVRIVEIASAMPFVRAETQFRSVDVMVITGTLAQWRDAVISGTQARGVVQACYCKIATIFEAAGLNVWTHCTKKYDKSNLFMLEDKRGK